METVEILEKARELISDESRWTKGEYARDDRGQDIEFNDPGACAFCALGAVLVASGAEDDCDSVTADADRRLTQEVGGSFINDVARFNDSHTHAEVLALFDRAIAAAREA